jgi:phosphotransferase system  glucose/maltose/N-acetylglucosamine-specific IIC component
LERLQEFAFVQVAMAVATIAFVWMGAAFPVGAMRGSRAGMRVLRSGVWFLLGGAFAVGAWAVVSGQLARFSSVFGLWELAEMFVFVAMFEFIVYFMADRYLVDKAAREAAGPEDTEKVETEDA